MAWIKEIEVEDATGKLKEVYKKIAPRGEVANILKVHSLNPGVLEAHLNLYKKVMFGKSGLSRSQREMIAVVVSSINDCYYWVVHHGEALRLVSKDDDLMKDIEKDYTKANISKEEKLMLHYAEKLTKEPVKVDESDIEGLRQAGFSDRDIFDMNQVVAYFNYVNRIAEGLGVTLEDK